MDWITLVQDRDKWWVLVNAIMKLWVVYKAGDFLTSVEPVSYSGSNLFHGASWLVGWLVSWLLG